MIILTDEEVAKLREALETTAFKSHDIAKREAALSVLDAAPTVGAVLGHRSSASTRRYAHLATDNLKAAIGRIGRKAA